MLLRKTLAQYVGVGVCADDVYSVFHFVDDGDDVFVPTAWFDYEGPCRDDPVPAVYSDHLIDFAPYDSDVQVSGIRKFPCRLRPALYQP